MRKFLILPIVLLALPSMADQAQSTTTPLDEIVVVASKIERPVSQVASKVTVISDKELDAILANSVADALQYVPGVNYESAGPRFGGVRARSRRGRAVAAPRVERRRTPPSPISR